nr:PREDICTED: interleukin-1 receptor type 2-like isoform X2 [Latimeria chalumnae]|eukprot:XP_006003639.1 PREDICTED: interleukin-1 receptor type 2-like isoform X2 [Latimeria chalumnae]
MLFRPVLSTGTGRSGLVFHLVLTLLGCTCLCAWFGEAGLTRHGYPKIFEPKNGRVGVSLGVNFTLHCQADMSFWGESVTIIYWLANSSFVEDVFPGNRVKEGEVSSNSSEETIQRDLLFSKISLQDCFTNFTCIVMNPSGTDQKSVRLQKA